MAANPGEPDLARFIKHEPQGQGAPEKSADVKQEPKREPTLDDVDQAYALLEKYARPFQKRRQLNFAKA